MTIFLLIFFLFLGYIIINWILDEKAPEEKTEATLIKKKTSTMIDANQVMHTTYLLIFDIEGTTKKFHTSRKIYKQYEEQQKGILIYKRKRFVDFIID